MPRNHANRLSDETSPYLLEHAQSPVDWHPWGKEALERARRESKPILLSVGYAASRRCRAMAKESFDDEAIAAVMNERFINIKVDRDERPDIDAVYQTAAQLLNGQGGWPLTVFLLPDQRPFYAGTYFPPEERSGLPGFPQLMQSLLQAYEEEPQRIERSAAQLTGALRQVDNRRVDAAAIVPPEEGPALLEKAAEWLFRRVDAENGGLGSAPILEFFLRWRGRSGDERRLAWLHRALEAMAARKLDDGPRLERRVEDSALLGSLYVQGWRLEPKPLYKRVVEETLACVDRELSHPDGGFFSAQRDERAIAGWTAMMASTFAQAAKAFEEPRYLRRAQAAIAFVEARMTREDRLLRTFSHGPGRALGFVTDYAWWVKALLDAHEASLDASYLSKAKTWMDRCLDLFWDEASPGFFLTGRDQEALIHRPKTWRDSNAPSGTGVAVQNMLRLDLALGDAEYEAKARAALETHRRQMDQHPWGVASLLVAYDAWIHKEGEAPQSEK